jgi:hypothetical protein
MNGIALEIRKASSPMFRILFFAFTILWSAGFAMAVIDRAQQIPESLYSEMKWRMIGPFRAGKVANRMALLRMRQSRTGRILAESLQPNVEHMRPFAQDDNGRGLALT